MRRPSIMAASLKSQHYGSFYLRMGAVGNYSFVLPFSVSQLEPQKFSVCTEVHISLDEATKFHVTFFHLAWAVWRRTFFVSLFQFQMLQITHVYRALNNNDDASKYRTVRLISSRRKPSGTSLSIIDYCHPRWIWTWVHCFLSDSGLNMSVMPLCCVSSTFIRRPNHYPMILQKTLQRTSMEKWERFRKKWIVVCNLRRPTFEVIPAFSLSLSILPMFSAVQSSLTP